jgi:hypothetical protein
VNGRRQSGITGEAINFNIYPAEIPAETRDHCNLLIYNGLY